MAWGGGVLCMTENVIINEVGASFLGYRLCFPELSLMPSLSENLGCYTILYVSG